MPALRRNDKLSLKLRYAFIPFATQQVNGGRVGSLILAAVPDTHVR
jgi:hypothetical protein